MMQEASKRRCNKIKFISLSFVSKLFSQKILINETGQTKTYFFRLDHTFYESFCINGIAIKAIPNRFNVISSLYVSRLHGEYNIFVFN